MPAATATKTTTKTSTENAPYILTEKKLVLPRGVSLSKIYPTDIPSFKNYDSEDRWYAENQRNAITLTEAQAKELYELLGEALA